MAEANSLLSMGLRQQIKEHRRRRAVSLNSKNRKLQEGFSCQDQARNEESYGGECTCLDDSRSPEEHVVSCVYPECEGDSCVEDPVLGVICAGYNETITFELQPTWGYYSETTYTVCIQYSGGREDVLCYTEEGDYDSNFTCGMRLNDSLFCSSCDECFLDCTNIPGGQVFDLCTDEVLAVPSDSVFVFLDDVFFEQCLASDDDYFSDAPSMEPSTEPSTEPSMELSMEPGM
ncbi:hypothetical protein ACA910_003371 [Epithemia clementina (nom. ined.)]